MISMLVKCNMAEICNWSEVCGHGEYHQYCSIECPNECTENRDALCVRG
jgi:hypothetical protein